MKGACCIDAFRERKLMKSGHSKWFLEFSESKFGD